MQTNHAHIAKAISEASNDLGGAGAGVRVSHESHYQFANRWLRVAPTRALQRSLIYLSFFGDTGIQDISPAIHSPNH